VTYVCKSYVKDMNLLYNHQRNIASMISQKTAHLCFILAVTNKVTCSVAIFFSIYHKSGSGMICKRITNVKHSSVYLAACCFQLAGR